MMRSDAWYIDCVRRIGGERGMIDVEAMRRRKLLADEMLLVEWAGDGGPGPRGASALGWRDAESGSRVEACWCKGVASGRRSGEKLEVASSMAASAPEVRVEAEESRDDRRESRLNGSKRAEAELRRDLRDLAELAGDDGASAAASGVGLMERMRLSEAKVGCSAGDGLDDKGEPSSARRSMFCDEANDDIHTKRWWPCDTPPLRRRRAGRTSSS